MNDAEEAVGKVLRGLREVQPDHGFEERTARRVRGAVRRREVRQRLRIWQGLAAGCAALTIVALTTNARLHGKRPLLPAIPRGEGSKVPLPPKPSVDLGLTALKVINTGSLEREAMLRSGLRSSANTARGPRPSASLEMPPAGFPAPPLPLTEQERLLLRAARDGDPQPPAVLQVSVLPTHDAEETAEFVEFFGQDRQVEQSRPGDSE